MPDPLYAHSLAGRLESEWELLNDHLACVAQRAAGFTSKFGADGWGRAAGQLHDIGKAKTGFQARLRGNPKPEPHAAEGAKAALAHYAATAHQSPFNAPFGQMLAFAIAGHHAGLANGIGNGGGLSPLMERLEAAADVTPWFAPHYHRIEQSAPPLLATLSQGPKGKTCDPFGWAFFVRMVFSALVDADRLETEKWYVEKADETVERGWTGKISDLKRALDAHLGGMKADDTPINRLRAEVLADARHAGITLSPGLFSLTVPTGGGKTLSSLAFALDHAVKHNLDRVIYVIPFTSIVEQTAEVFRRALGDDTAILEHHSGFDAEKLDPPNDEENPDGSEKIRRDTENWDRPIIVTTAVQFFESLFSNQTGRCRKLHNIARSVIVLDEAQTLPLPVLRPCLAALTELSRGYGTSVVLCTATQPALTEDAGLKAPEALVRVREIVAPGRELYTRLKRVRTERAAILSDGQLIQQFAEVDQGLIIVNNRRHARELFDKLDKTGLPGARHLTTAMTAAHRQAVLADIRLDLTSERPVRLVSTSLIEAGVDISFKAVWRAWAGLDQIAQAAGRCNRNGELGIDGGRLTIFEPEQVEGRKPPRELELNADIAMRVLGRNAEMDPLSPEAVTAYFAELLWTKDDGHHIAALDAKKVGERKIQGIMNATRESAHGLNFCFADIAQAFQIIEDVMVPVIIPASIKAHDRDPDAVMRTLDYARSAGGIARAVQRHIVQIPQQARSKLVASGAAVVVRPNVFGDQFVRLINGDIYTTVAGLDWDNPTFRSIEGGII